MTIAAAPTVAATSQAPAAIASPARSPSPSGAAACGTGPAASVSRAAASLSGALPGVAPAGAHWYPTAASDGLAESMSASTTTAMSAMVRTASTG